MRSAGVQPALSTRRVAGVLDLLLLGRRLLQQGDGLGGGVGGLEVDEHLGQLGVQLAARGRIVRVEPADQPGDGRRRPGRPKRLRTTW